MSPIDLHLHPAVGELAVDWLAACRAVLGDEGWASGEVAVTACWANAPGPGNSHRAHAHPNSLVSGVLYVAVP